ncbi:YggS family pyridoxal phosphate-dependent enzyme [Kineococcus sp. NPDC059986]|uniref:YggS family pyridoxal phosphate-dependent enzyme n=1 Tax=Kineococcus sp. NPDC059986 TaxID=3155538 RepID=UPI00344DF742
MSDGVGDGVGDGAGAGDRTAELAAALARTTARTEAAARSAGRDPAELTLVVVTKFFPADDVARLAGLGVRDVGESRDQEAAAKAAELADLDLHWHFIGQLQTNKARSVAAYADVVHSVDRTRLAAALQAGAAHAGRRVGCFVQVDLAAGLGLDVDGGRGGAAGDDVLRVADAVAAGDDLDLRGVMAVAPRDVDPARAFAELARTAERLRAEHPGAVEVSAGMSGDLEEAVAAGATHLRVGSAILGSRPAAR